jgi:hypothetical protein
MRLHDAITQKTTIQMFIAVKKLRSLVVQDYLQFIVRTT